MLSKLYQHDVRDLEILYISTHYSEIGSHTPEIWLRWQAPPTTEEASGFVEGSGNSTKMSLRSWRILIHSTKYRRRSPADLLNRFALKSLKRYRLVTFTIAQVYWFVSRRWHFLFISRNSMETTHRIKYLLWLDEKSSDRTAEVIVRWTFPEGWPYSKTATDVFEYGRMTSRNQNTSQLNTKCQTFITFTLSNYIPELTKSVCVINLCLRFPCFRMISAQGIRNDRCKWLKWPIFWSCGRNNGGRLEIAFAREWSCSELSCNTSGFSITESVLQLRKTW